MIDFLQYGFMQRAIIAGIMISIITALVGIFLVQKRLSLIGDGLAHAAFGGIAVGFLLNINPLATGIIFSLLGSLGIQRLIEKTKSYGDSAIALVLAGGMAIAIVIIGHVRGFNANLFSYLIGSILSISEFDLLLLGLVLAAVLLFVAFFHKQLLFTILNEDLARLSGINVPLLNSALIVITAITTVIAIRAVGILMVTGLIVIPALTAFQLAKSFRESAVYAVAMSLFCVLAGIAMAFIFDLPPSGVIILAMLGVFSLSLVKL